MNIGIFTDREVSDVCNIDLGSVMPVCFCISCLPKILVSIADLSVCSGEISDIVQVALVFKA